MAQAEDIMRESANDKELSVFGFAKGMRAGLVTFIMALQTVAIIYLFIAYSNSKDRNEELQADLYEKMIEYMKPAKDHMNDAADKVNTAAERAISSSDTVDSLTNELNKRKTIK